MFVDHLSLTDFRSYPTAEVALGPGVTVFVGANGQGKTNLVEAIEFLSTLSSHRVASDAPLVRFGSGQAVVRAGVRAGLADDRRLLLELEINPGRANRARINRSPLPRVRELTGALRTVVFSPEDLAIVKGEPSDRRGWIDALVTTRWPRLAGVRADYERVLKQRNTLLKSLSGRSGRLASAGAASTLDAWSAQLAQLGADLLAARLNTLTAVMPQVSAAYAEIAPVNNRAAAEYRAGVPTDQPDRGALQEALLARMVERRGEEIARGVSLVGPHRDEIAFSIGTLPAKGYASHGESWSLALALRLGGFALLREEGIEAVLVLDDVFAELDAERRERLAAGVEQAEQVLVTAAVPADVPARLAGRRYRVHAGEITAGDNTVDEQFDRRPPVEGAIDRALAASVGGSDGVEGSDD